jgi:predicted enzyme related to lactoylglutathione lyase
VNFNSILIGSEDPQRLVEFYTKVLGEPAFTYEPYTGWQLGSGTITVGPHSEVHGRNAEPGRLIWNIESTDVRADFARMRDAGATVIAEPYTMDDDPTDSAIATLADPDGNYFQLASPMDPSAM